SPFRRVSVSYTVKSPVPPLTDGAGFRGSSDVRGVCDWATTPMSRSVSIRPSDLLVKLIYPSWTGWYLCSILKVRYGELRGVNLIHLHIYKSSRTNLSIQHCAGLTKRLRN